MQIEQHNVHVKSTGMEEKTDGPSVPPSFLRSMMNGESSERTGAERREGRVYVHTEMRRNLNNLEKPVIGRIYTRNGCGLPDKRRGLAQTLQIYSTSFFLRSERVPFPPFLFLPVRTCMCVCTNCQRKDNDPQFSEKQVDLPTTTTTSSLEEKGRELFEPNSGISSESLTCPSQK